MKGLSKILLLSALAGSVSLAGDPLKKDDKIEAPSRMQLFFRGVDADLDLFPQLYKKELDKECEKAVRRLDPRLMALNYSMTESQEPSWDSENNIFNEDLDALEDLTKEILKDALSGAADELPHIDKIYQRLRGFAKGKAQLKIKPSVHSGDYSGIPPEARQKLEKERREDEYAISAKTRDKTPREVLNKLFGDESEFRTGVDLHSLDSVGYFVKLRNPKLWNMEFEEIRTEYIFEPNDSCIKFEAEKKLPNGFYLELEGRQRVAGGKNSKYGFEVSKQLTPNSHIAFGASTGKNTNAFLRYKARF